LPSIRAATKPLTGADLSRIEIPNWTRLLALAASCYDVTQLGYLGCDIVIDQQRGPLLLELNARPGLSIQITNDEGLLPRLGDIQALDVFTPTLEDRVEYASIASTTSVRRLSGKARGKMRALETTLDRENHDDRRRSTH
jgi:hypothetical protein